MSLKIRLTDQAESGHTYQVCRATQWLFKVHRFHPIKALFLKNKICEVQTDTLGQGLAKETAKTRGRELDDGHLEYFAKVGARSKVNRVRGAVVKRADVVSQRLLL